jgi:hypothetical protein
LIKFIYSHIYLVLYIGIPCSVSYKRRILLLNFRDIDNDWFDNPRVEGCSLTLFDRRPESVVSIEVYENWMLQQLRSDDFNLRWDIYSECLLAPGLLIGSLYQLKCVYLKWRFVYSLIRLTIWSVPRKRQRITKNSSMSTSGTKSLFFILPLKLFS